MYWEFKLWKENMCLMGGWRGVGGLLAYFAMETNFYRPPDRHTRIESRLYKCTIWQWEWNIRGTLLYIRTSQIITLQKSVMRGQPITSDYKWQKMQLPPLENKPVKLCGTAWWQEEGACAFGCVTSFSIKAVIFYCHLKNNALVPATETRSMTQLWTASEPLAANYQSHLSHTVKSQTVTRSAPGSDIFITGAADSFLWH